MKKTSIGACVGCIIGLIIGIIVQTLLMGAWNITIPLNGSEVDFLQLTLAVLVPIPAGLIFGPIIGYLIAANIEKLEFYKLEQLKRENYATDSEFFDAIGKKFTRSPMFFMESIHRRLSKKVSKKYGDEKRREMERYIIENYCLYEGEKILFECDGSVNLATKKYKISSHSGGIFVTNQRIIGQGVIQSSSGGAAFARRASRTKGSVIGEAATEITAQLVPGIGAVVGLALLLKPSGVKEAKEKFIELSVRQKLPCYGYNFPMKYLFDIKKGRRSIDYFVAQGENLYLVKISSPSFKKLGVLDNLYEILSQELIKMTKNNQI
ncbi:MAG: hypothetical protein ACFE9N_06385 [Promethearchaeota archaeon]